MNNGRYYITDLKTGRKFCVEPIDEGNHVKWGDINPATKKLEGGYGQKYKGGIEREDSIINEENGFKNIVELGPGESPDSYINQLLKDESSVKERG